MVVVAPQDCLDEVPQPVGHEDKVAVVAGGDSRQASVRSGLELVRADRVVVHDAARPLARVGDVHGVVRALDDADGAIVAVPVDETLKRVRGRRVVATLERSALWRAQTPQAFRTGILRDAHQRALEEGFEATDDAQLLERYGAVVVVIEGSRANLKVTYPEDFAIAEAILRGRG